MRRVLLLIAKVLGLLLGLYLIVRAALEPFVINVADPDTYRNDWGGPDLAGVLAAHCGPGLLAAVTIGAVLFTRYRSGPRDGRRRDEDTRDTRRPEAGRTRR